MYKVTRFWGLFILISVATASAQASETTGAGIDLVPTVTEFEMTGQNTLPIKIFAIETRDSNFTALYSTSPEPFPNEGCDLDDRAIIVDSQGSGWSMFQSAQTAYRNFDRVTIRVDGCAVIAPQTSVTAPRIVRMLVKMR